MKHTFFTLLICIVCKMAMADARVSHHNGTQVINQSDTVVFDISQATVNINQVSFPVYFLSDDTINALDFSFKYNHAGFSFDTILDLTNYLNEVSNYNTGDSTVYFTSYSLQQITNDTPLVSIQFTIMGGQFCSNDLSSILVYLNGDPCALRVIDCILDNLSDINISDSRINIYPNPATEIINVAVQEDAMVQLFDLRGSQILETKAEANEKLQLSTENIAEGIYMLKIFNSNFVSTKKVVVGR